VVERKPLKIFIIAGEASGDNLGGKLCEQLSKKLKCEFLGVAGPKMIAKGVKTIFPIENISLMGFIEILPKIFQIKRLINLTIDEIKKFDPDIIITIDSPGFNFRVIKYLNVRAKKLHYVSPSVWAYKPDRVYFMAKIYDKVLALLPFEPAYYKKTNLECVYVGHPILEDKLDKGKSQRFRTKYGIKNNAVVITVMCGSRKNEIYKMLDIFIQAINMLKEQCIQKEIHVGFPYVTNEHKNIIQAHADKMNFEYNLIPQDGKIDLYAASNLALVKSGTSSLELAIAEVPMVVAYKVNFLTVFILKYIFRVKSFVSIINILAKKEVIPEKLQSHCNPLELQSELKKFLNSSYANKQIIEFKKQKKILEFSKKISPSEKAAEEVLKLIEKHIN
jgi:lipid-A-disaccharide synthase